MAWAVLEACKNEANVSRVGHDMLTHTRIHEVGHTCGLSDQRNPDGSSFAMDVKSGPVCRNSSGEEMIIAVLETLLPQSQSMTLGRGSRCTEIDACRSHGSLKDN